MNEGEVSEVTVGDPAEDRVAELVQEEVAAFLAKMTGATAPPQNAHVSRWKERDNRRQANAKLAREAAHRRVARKTNIGIVERVERAKTRLRGVNVAGAIEVINGVSDTDRDYFLLAEKYDQARNGVLRQYGNALRSSVETAYLAEAGLASPEHDPE